MSVIDYEEAYKQGRKSYQSMVMQGKRPTLPVLDNVLPKDLICKEVPIGIIEIPMDQIKGTKTESRSRVFAENFMPIQNDGSEFSMKWVALSEEHLRNGIHDPIIAYEYKHEYYILEGNKRVSVLKYFGADSITGSVIRLVPPNTEEHKVYYEFLDFYEWSKIHYVVLTTPGAYLRLQKLVGKEVGDAWSEEERMRFRSLYSHFKMMYEEQGGKKLSITTGDAFLVFAELYGYCALEEMTVSEMKEKMLKSWEELEILQEEIVKVSMVPTEEKKTLFQKLLTGSLAKKQKIAFIYIKTPKTSAWTYAHELGRKYIEEVYGEEVQTVARENVTEENIDEVLEEVIEDGCNLIFTTAPVLASASVRAAIAHPKVNILNCSVNTAHRYIRSYYSRMYEGKFLMGMIAGAMAENDHVIYVADHLVYGTVANINAFALGAKMVNPRVKIELLWEEKEKDHLEKYVMETEASCISGRDMIIPENGSRYYGVYYKKGNEMMNLAMPLWHWGKFYEKLLEIIFNGVWKEEDEDTAQALNYWWGMSADVIDVVYSNNLPNRTKQLVEVMKSAIEEGRFEPFTGELYAQNGEKKQEAGVSMAPEEMMKMDWLLENIVGEIPEKDDANFSHFR